MQAKIADGRANEAEQRLEGMLFYKIVILSIAFYILVLQAELLQSQAEVKRLLNRLNEFSRERREMVSGHVHTQLLQISDERAETAERKVKELEQQVYKNIVHYYRREYTYSIYSTFKSSESVQCNGTLPIYFLNQTLYIQFKELWFFHPTYSDHFLNYSPEGVWFLDGLL